MIVQLLLAYFIQAASAETLDPAVQQLSAGTDLCTLRCKDNHMSKNMDNEWSSAFTLPILNLLRRTGNISAAHAKVHQICQVKEEDRRRGVEIELLELDKGEDEDDDIAIELGVSKEKKMSWVKINNMKSYFREDQAFDDCLSRCNNTIEAEIIRLGLNSFKDACESKRLESQLGCWKAHTNDIETSCLEYTTRLRRAKLCEWSCCRSTRASQLLEMCAGSEYVRFSGCLESEFARNCGYESALLTRQMSERSRKSIFQMLSLKFKNLPSSCSPSNAYRRDVTADFLTGTGLFYSSTSSATLFHISCIVYLFTQS
ncbi:hypothetical protein PRIPAC_88410 [Pristionchus pacificus]|uniref:Uncharacterized protein n=1 Tax=Pristionchus pacificus TaxID=54126 RepID=A0A2A6B3K7_PRIPA|nr:hypothetical protein PRIPAC_88410 [Pristionchus pacificus]|eukprot:PDM60441.1 hypothetical protein PRIPAC_53419 [Pristionchus pacificus]